MLTGSLLAAVIAACRIHPLRERRLSRCRPLAFLGLLLQRDGLQPELVVLHCGGFKLEPRGQIGDFFRRARRRETAAQLFESLRARCDSRADVFGKTCLNADVARVEIESRA